MMGSKKVNIKTNSKTIIFRELQVMSINYRLIYSCYFTVVMMIAIMSVHTISLFSCLRLGDELPVAMLLFYIVCSFDCAFIILFVYGGLADVLKASRSLQSDLKGKAEFQIDRWFRRYLRSFQTVKVHFGETSFIDEITPLIFEDFVIQQTVSLLLLKWGQQEEELCCTNTFLIYDYGSNVPFVCVSYGRMLIRYLSYAGRKKLCLNLHFHNMFVLHNSTRLVFVKTVFIFYLDSTLNESLRNSLI